MFPFALELGNHLARASGLSKNSHAEILVLAARIEERARIYLNWDVPPVSHESRIRRGLVQRQRTNSGAQTCPSPRSHIQNEAFKANWNCLPVVSMVLVI